MDIRLAQLRHFLLVVETKNFRAAAARAYRSQPALSQSIHQLEAKLGQPLFERGSRRTLTPFGETCLPLIKELVAHIEGTSASILNLAHVSGGRVSVAMVPSIASRWLSALLETFVKRYPAVEVNVHAEDSRNVFRLVRDGEVDFGLSTMVSPDPNIDFRPMLEERFGLLCRADHPLAKLNRPIPWRLLKHEQILGNLAHNLLVGKPAWRYIAQPRIHVSNLSSLVTLVEQGLGVTPIPALLSPVDSPALRFIPLASPVETRTIGIMSRAGRSLMPAAKAMAELFQQQLHSTVTAKKGLQGIDRSMVKVVATQ